MREVVGVRRLSEEGREEGREKREEKRVSCLKVRYILLQCSQSQHDPPLPPSLPPSFLPYR